MLTILAVIPAQDGRSDELGIALLANVADSRREDGNIRYDVHQSNDDSSIWMMYENWTSQDALNAHFQQPYMKEFIERLPDLMKGDLKLQKFTKKSSAEA